MTTAETPNAQVLNLHEARKQQAAARKGRTSGGRKPAPEKVASPAKAAPAAKAAKAPAKPSGRPAPQPRPEQKPGTGEVKIRLGAAIKAVVLDGKIPASVRAKIDAAHVYKDGSAVIVLTAKEGSAVKALLAGQTSRSAQAVIKAIDGK
jgi:hypothetical protein